MADTKVHAPDSLRAAAAKQHQDWTRPLGEPRQQMRGRKKGKRVYQFPNSLQMHIDREDRRIKDLTEGILYEFLPAALNVMVPVSDDVGSELKPERCRAVAGAALCVASLMNAPPGFLEFLCCVPWNNLAELYPSFRADAIETLMPQLQVTAEERVTLLNTPLQPALLDCVLEFLYSPLHAHSVPPMIRLTTPLDVRPVSRDVVAALLDGATPLHCAAIRGSPAQIEHLINHGADLYTPTSAGEIALELVPVCHRGKTHDACRCIGYHDQQVWKCMSSEARQKLCRMGLVNMSHGVLAWLHLCLLVLLCMLGLWGHHTSLNRPSLTAHMEHRARARREEVKQLAQSLLDTLRREATAGTEFLLMARDTEDDLRIDLVEKAFECFVMAIHSLQRLKLGEGGGTLAPGLAELGLTGAPDLHVEPMEQADLYCSWAQSVLLKYRTCMCPECENLASQSIQMAHMQLSRLFTTVGFERAAQPQQWERVGHCLVKVLHAHASMLLETEASSALSMTGLPGQHAVTRAAVWRALSCLKEWHSLELSGLSTALSAEEVAQITTLEKWANTANSDLCIAEALAGAPAPPTQPLGDILSAAVVYDIDGSAFLVRRVYQHSMQKLEDAKRVAANASPRLSMLLHEVTTNAYGELSAAAQLQGALSARQPAANVGAAMAQLHAAIDAASRYPHLEAEVHEALGLRERLAKRARAVAQLEAVLAKVQEAISGGLDPAVAEQRDAFVGQLQEKLDMLQSAMDAVRQEGIPVNHAKRLHKDLEAQRAALEVGAQLDEVLRAAPCGSGVLKTALSKAERVSAATTGNTSNVALGSEFLAPRVQAVKRQLDLERAAETLGRTAQAAKSIEALPKLEAAILAAKKVGADELDPESYRLASDTRARLEAAARHRQQLELSVRVLQRSSKPEDADSLTQVIEDASEWGELLSADTAKATAALTQWRAAASAEEKLARTLREGGTAHQLSRAIQEAAAMGVHVEGARKMLKLIQGVEAAVAAVGDGPQNPAALKTRIDAADQGGCPPAVLAAPRRLLAKILISEARDSLEAALKARAAQTSTQRTAALQAALGRARAVLGEEEEEEEGTEEEEEGVSRAGSRASQRDDGDEVAVLRGMVRTAQRQLRAAHKERERIEAERQEEQRLRRERLIKEREEREAQRAERERQERERTSKDRAARLEKERQVLEVLTALTDHSSYAAVKAQREREDRAAALREKEAQMEVAIPVRRAIPITRLPQPEGSGGAAQLLRTVASNASEAASAQSSEAAADAVPLPLFSASSVGPGAAVPEPTPATPLHPATSTPAPTAVSAAPPSAAFLQGLPTKLLADLAPNAPPAAASSQFPAPTTTRALFGADFGAPFNAPAPAASPAATPSLWAGDLAASVAEQDGTLPTAPFAVPSDASLFADFVGGSWGLSSPVFMPPSSSAAPASGARLWQEGPVPEDGPALPAERSLKLANGPSLNALGFVSRDSEGLASNSKRTSWSAGQLTVNQPREMCPEYQRGFCRAGSKCLKRHGSSVATSGALPPMQPPPAASGFGSALPFGSLETMVATGAFGVAAPVEQGIAGDGGIDTSTLFGAPSPLLGSDTIAHGLFGSGTQGNDAGSGEGWKQT